MFGFIDQDVGLDNVHQRRKVTPVLETHPLEVAVDHSLLVHINQTLRDVSQLRNHLIVSWDARNLNQNLRDQTDLHPDAPSRTG